MRRRESPFAPVDALLIALPLVAFLALTRFDDLFAPGLVPYAQFTVFVSVALLLTAAALRRGQAQGARLAYTDELTGLNNRRSFTETLARSRSPQPGKGTMQALLLLDLDRFKLVNDALGHPAGDELLRIVAGRLTASLPVGSFVARLGGDEFAVIVSVRNATEAINLAEDVLEDLNQPVHVGGQELWPNASIGVAVHNGGHTPPAELFSMADVALYQAKARGKGRVYLYDSRAQLPAARALSLEAELHLALEQKQFELLLQPIVNLLDRRIVGAEALLRWNHPRLGTLMPDSFLALAEEIGISRRLSRWMVEAVSAKAGAWEHLFEDRLTLGVNVPVADFQSLEFVRSLGQVAQQARAPVRTLNLEVTESALMGDAATQASLIEAKKLGFMVTIDNFGVGYSSLNYLRNNRADMLKLDPAFVRATNQRTFRIVRAVVDLAHSLGMKVVAEGVETEEQCARMLEAGCDQGQGPFFARPMTAQELTELLADRSVTLPQPGQRGIGRRRARTVRGRAGDWSADVPYGQSA